MNLPIDHNGVPAHLRAIAGDPLNAAVVAGVVGTMAPARISYRGSKFRLVDKDGVESDPFITNDKGLAELENNGVAMDIVIVGANQTISKIYYDQAYDPNADTAPACFSDNGVAPSERSGRPQSLTCASCAHNVWGSAVNPATGKARQACNNSKKLAVVRYKDESNIIYALGIPGASLKPYEAAMKAVVSHGYRISGIIWRVSFDREVAFPKLDWKAVGFLDEEAMAEFEVLQRHDEVRLATGADDVAMTAAAIEAHRGGTFTGQQQGRVTIVDRDQFLDPRTVVQNVQRPQRLDLPQAKTIVTSGPMAAPPASPNPVPTVTPPGMPEHTRAALAEQPKRGRGRPRKDSAEVQSFDRPAPQHVAPPPPSPAPDVEAPVGAPQRQGPAELPEATSDMDDALSRAMGIKV